MGSGSSSRNRMISMSSVCSMSSMSSVNGRISRKFMRSMSSMSNMNGMSSMSSIFNSSSLMNNIYIYREYRALWHCVSYVYRECISGNDALNECNVFL